MIEPLTTRAEISVSVNPSGARFLPILFAHDSGAFHEAGLDVTMRTSLASVVTQQELIESGEVDLGAVSPLPHFFHSMAQSRRLSLIASVGAPRPGRSELAWLSYSTKSRFRPGDEDFSGLVFEASQVGHAGDLLTREFMLQRNLEPGKDVELTRKTYKPQDMVDALAIGSADIVSVPEPYATISELAGASTRWLGFNDIAPWHQISLLAASNKIVADRPDAVAKFLAVYIATCRKLNALEGTWDSDVLTCFAEWANLSKDVVVAHGLLQAWHPDGEISVEGLRRGQQIWIDAGEVVAPIEVEGLINTSLRTAALDMLTASDRNG
jgi:ABC-type nitrate/sulfonate/bicarbonate transport system substrate-binding protein